MASLQVQSRAPTSSTAGFRVRAARRGDSERIRALLEELGFEGGTDSATLNWVVSHPEIEVFVATDGRDHPVALMTLSHRPQLRLKGRILCVDELVVATAWRRQGVGTALLARARERARALSVRRLELRTHAPQAESHERFLEATGFSGPATVVVPHRDP